MSTEPIDIVALEALLVRTPARSGESDPIDAPGEHPLARKLRAVLANPHAHRIGDLARVVDEIHREMAMFKDPNGQMLDLNR